MRIIFQDIDGPLIPFRMYYRGSRPYDVNGASFVYDPVAVDMINTLCAQCDAQVVFNTAHNENPHAVMKGQAQFNRIAKLHPTIKTNYMTDPGLNRYSAISDWLKRHPDVTEWVVFDDYALPSSRAVKIDFDIGMTLDSFTKGYEILMGKKYPGIQSILGTTHG